MSMHHVKGILAITLFLFITTGFFACKNDNKPTRASSTGSPGEIIVVAENNIWSSSLGDSIREFFGTDRVGLPQPEPLYKTVQINLKEFQRLFQTHRNVFAISIDSSLTESKVEMVQNVWSSPQRVVKITAPSLVMLKGAFNENKREILNMFENAEIERLQALYSKTLNIKGVELVRSKFNIDINIPADYFLAVNKDNFLWFRREANILSQGILIYAYPYTDTVAFNPFKILSVRDQYTRLFVPGPSDSSYMIVARDFITPVTRTLSIQNNLAIETRGLWEVRKDFMGGPFINYTLVDKRNNMVIALDGYVYAPNANKADLIKQVQAMLLTFEFYEK